MANVDRDEIVKNINSRRLILNNAKKKLKKDFIGLDNVIDKIFQNMEIWYTIPQAITRPVIINLWGMTGVGKTDLVRKLVKYIGFMDRFVEMQMDCGNEENKSVESKLMGSSIEEDSPGILLLDEIQRFRTINEQGHEIDDSSLKDVWMLLSDGRFNSSGDSKVRFLEKILEDLYWSDYEKAEGEDEPDDDEDDEDDPKDPLNKLWNKSSKKKKKKKKPYKRMYHTSVFEANSIKKTLRLKDSLETIMMWTKEKKISMITSVLNNPDSYEGSDFRKLLIFISGNLDEAYEMASMANDADIDANTLHEFSKKITVIDIKKALKMRFKPEHIARLGNIHIIYPAFSRRDFERLISKKISEFVVNIKRNTSIKLKIDKSINKVIYRNGVYPAQGVRPVFSSVGAVLDTNIPRFICTAIEDNVDEVFIKFKDEKLYGMVGDKEVTSDVIKLDLDIIRNKIEDDDKMMVSVHEAGHAVVYATLFKLSPTQTTSSTLKNGGYMFPHTIIWTKETIFKTIQVLFAGTIAESLIFGETNITSGCSHDISEATAFASNYIRSYGFGEFKGIIDSETKDESQLRLSYIKESDVFINKILEDQYEACKKILSSNLPFLKSVVLSLLKNGDLNADQFYSIGRRYIPDLNSRTAAEKIYHNYAEIGKNFFDAIEV